MWHSDQFTSPRPDLVTFEKEWKNEKWAFKYRKPLENKNTTVPYPKIRALKIFCWIVSFRARGWGGAGGFLLTVHTTPVGIRARPSSTLPLLWVMVPSCEAQLYGPCQQGHRSSALIVWGPEVSGYREGSSCWLWKQSDTNQMGTY